MYRSSPPSAGAWYTIDAALKPYCGRAATLSSIMTATGKRLAVPGFAGRPSSHAKPGAAVGAGEAESSAVGAVLAIGACEAMASAEGATDDPRGDTVGGLDPQPASRAAATKTATA